MIADFPYWDFDDPLYYKHIPNCLLCIVHVSAQLGTACECLHTLDLGVTMKTGRE